MKLKMKKILLFIVTIVGTMVFLTSCGKSSESKYIGTWQDVTDPSAAFTISNSDKGLVLKASGESATLAVTAHDNSLAVDGVIFTLDEQKQELSVSGLFDSKIVFRKVAGEQK